MAAPRLGRTSPLLGTVFLILGLADTGVACVGPCASMPVVLSEPTLTPQTVDGVTDAACPERVFEVFLRQGHGYRFSTWASSPPRINFDPLMDAFGPSCDLLLSVDDELETRTYPSFDLVPIETGLHRIVIRSWAGDTGTFSLTYSELGAPGGSSCAEPHGFLQRPQWECQAVEGDLDSGDEHTWQVHLSSNELYWFSLCRYPCDGAGADFDGRLEIVQPDGSVRPTSRSTCGDDESVHFAPYPTGDYCIKVRSDAGSGSYVLSTKRFCYNGGYSAPLSLDDSRWYPAVGHFECEASHRYFADLMEGQTAIFTFCGEANSFAKFDSRLELRAPDGSTVAASTDACGDDGRVVYTVAPGGGGRYTLYIHRENGFGRYLLKSRILPCIGPSTVEVEPASGVADSSSCARTELFEITATGTEPLTIDWDIEAPVGGAASPTAGTLTAVGAASSFSTTLTGAGDYLVRVTAGNECGSVTSEIVYELRDETPPTLSPPANVRVECPEPASGPGSLTEWLASAVASDACSEPVVTSRQVASTEGCGATWSATYRLIAIDAAGNSSPAVDRTYEVIDTTPPVIAPSTRGAACLWPPRHDFVAVAAEAFAPEIIDGCSGVAWWLDACASDQPEDGLGDGHTSGDCSIQADGRGLLVRSERQGGAPSGRTYTAFARAVDDCGNVSALTPIGAVHVPRDRRGAARCLELATSAVSGSGSPHALPAPSRGR